VLLHSSIYFQLLAVACLVLFSSGGQLFSDVTRTAFTYGVFGAYIIIPLFLIAGFVIGEETPILLVSIHVITRQVIRWPDQSLKWAANRGSFSGRGSVFPTASAF
jgi:hypothetical protein